MRLLRSSIDLMNRWGDDGASVMREAREMREGREMREAREMRKAGNLR